MCCCQDIVSGRVQINYQGQGGQLAEQEGWGFTTNSRQFPYTPTLLGRQWEGVGQDLLRKYGVFSE